MPCLMPAENRPRLRNRQAGLELNARVGSLKSKEQTLPSLTVENYVKAIYQISAEQRGEPAATGQLAAALGVSPGTVTSMLKTLQESNLAEYTPHHGARLTSSGHALALRV